MFVNREVNHVDSEPASGSLRRPQPGAFVDADAHPTPYRVSTPELIDTPIVTENLSPVVLPAAPQPHRDEDVQLEISRDNMHPVGPDTGLR